MVRLLWRHRQFPGEFGKGFICRDRGERAVFIQIENDVRDGSLPSVVASGRTVDGRDGPLHQCHVDDCQFPWNGGDMRHFTAECDRNREAGIARLKVSLNPGTHSLLHCGNRHFAVVIDVLYSGDDLQYAQNRVRRRSDGVGMMDRAVGRSSASRKQRPRFENFRRGGKEIGVTNPTPESTHGNHPR
jgi:hypothetical protein